VSHFSACYTRLVICQSGAKLNITRYNGQFPRVLTLNPYIYCMSCRAFSSSSDLPTPLYFHSSFVTAALRSTEHHLITQTRPHESITPFCNFLITPPGRSSVPPEWLPLDLKYQTVDPHAPPAHSRSPVERVNIATFATYSKARRAPYAPFHASA